MNEGLKKIGILTDTISDLPESISKKFGIEVIPVKIHIDEKTYLDKVEITDEEFFKLLQDPSIHAKTSQPSPYDFQVIFEKMLTKYETVSRNTRVYRAERHIPVRFDGKGSRWPEVFGQTCAHRHETGLDG